MGVETESFVYLAQVSIMNISKANTWIFSFFFSPFVIALRALSFMIEILRHKI